MYIQEMKNMSEKFLTNDEINTIILKNAAGGGEVADVSLCCVGEKVFFEPPSFTEADWAQKENIKFPYYIGEIAGMESIKEGKIKVKSLQQNVFLPLGETGEFDVSKLCAYSLEAEKGIDDMVNLDKLNNATLLFNLKQRYEMDQKQIYTYVTPSLLVINPFKAVPHLMTPELFTSAKEYLNNERLLLKDTFPHTYSISALALRQLFIEGQRQAIVISGESGAGKTETAKIAMSFLAGCSSSGASTGGKLEIERRILACNPVLEAFGNAKTARNHNSSRFGKYVKILFDINHKKILGAFTKPYLLEKSRVIKLTYLDRNYHVFYQLIKGAPVDLLKQLFMVGKTGDRPSKDQYEYLKFGCDDLPIKLVNDVENYYGLVTSLQDLGFSGNERIAIWQLLAAVLHIGNIELNNEAYNEYNNSPCDVKNRDALESAAKMLGCTPEELQYEITYRGTVGDAKRSVCRPVEALNQRNTLAKALYQSLFTWLVRRMNVEILDDPSLLTEIRPGIQTIGLLDIFGFECFAINDYEQLLINYTNEKLQKLYLNAIFESEKTVFREEELTSLIGEMKYLDKTSTVIELLDNRAIGKPQGLFHKVDDYKKNEDMANFLSLINREFAKHQNLANHKDRDKFIIKHTAKNVVYCAKEFIEKNQDKMSDDLKALMISKFSPSIIEILKDDQTAAGNTIWKKFATQIRDLMDELGEPSPGDKKNPESCELHFIRCIKPNEKASSNLFVDSLVLQQIGYMGVLDSIIVRKMNFPNRMIYHRFYERYEDLCSISYSIPFKKLQEKKEDFRKLSKQLIGEQLGEIGKELYAFGTTKIFLKNEILAVLEQMRGMALTKKNEASQYIQDYVLMQKGRFILSKKIKMIVKIQKQYRKFSAYLKTSKALNFILKIEKAVLNYKIEKRKDAEEAASKIIAQQCYCFSVKEIIQFGIFAQQIIVKNMNKIIGLNKIETVSICNSLVLESFQKAWAIIFLRFLENSSITLVQYLRGHIARARFAVQIKQARERAMLIRTAKASTLIQKRIKGRLVREQLNILRHAVDLIKSFFLMKWLTNAFRTARRATIKIQRKFRAYVEWKHEIESQWKEFYEKQEGKLNKLQSLENCLLFGAAHCERDSVGVEEQFGTLPFELLNSLVVAATKSKTSVIAQHIKPVSPFASQKIFPLTIVCDLQVLCDTSLAYEQTWGANWNALCADSLDMDCPILGLALGSAHTLSVSAKSHIFSWGLNQHGECAASGYNVTYDPRSRIVVSENRLCQIACGNSHSVALDFEGNVFTWGNNQFGQLGIGNYNDISQPQKVNFGTSKGEVRQISACGDVNAAVTKHGEVFMWPGGVGEEGLSEASSRSFPARIPFTEFLNIESVGCGYNFVVLQSVNGLLYSFGSASVEGQLGQGDILPRTVPELIVCLKEAGVKIQSFSCGYKHCIARCSLGKVFSWGWGKMGQLGHGSFECELSPRRLIIPFEIYKAKEADALKKKIVQVLAGNTHSAFMTETRQIFWFGTSGSLKMEPCPIRIPLEEKIPEIFANKNIMPSGVLNTSTGATLANTMSFFTPIKINIAWSLTMSCTYVTVLDMRSLASNISTSSKTVGSFVSNPSSIVHLNSQIALLASRWSPQELDPPYMEQIAGLFPASLMSKSKMSPSKKSVVGRPSSTAMLGKILRNSEINYSIVSVEKSILSHAKKIETELRAALEKDSETQTEREKYLISTISRKVCK